MDNMYGKRPIKKSKLSIIANNLSAFGGGERWTLEAASLLKGKFDITIVNPTPREVTARVPITQLLNKYNVRGIRILNLPCGVIKTNMPGIGKVATLVLNTESKAALEAAVEGSDIIYSMNMNPLLQLSAMRFAKKYRKPFILGMHNPELIKGATPHEKPYKRLMRRSYNMIQMVTIKHYTTAMHVQTETQLRLLRKSSYKGAIYYIPHFLYRMKGIGSENPTRKKIILFVGRPSTYQKGIDLLSEIVRKALQYDKSITFHLVGKGEDGEAIMKGLASAYSDNVKYLGFLPDQKLDDEYKNASLFILPSRYETPGLALLEAQSFGVPAIAFRVPGPTDIIKKRFQGILIEPFNTEKFARAIVSYCSAETAYKIKSEIRLRIRNEIRDRYSKERFIRDFTRMLKEQAKMGGIR